jgi:hypothetical protein
VLRFLITFFVLSSDTNAFELDLFGASFPEQRFPDTYVINFINFTDGLMHSYIWNDSIMYSCRRFSPLGTIAISPGKLTTSGKVTDCSYFSPFSIHQNLFFFVSMMRNASKCIQCYLSMACTVLFNPVPCCVIPILSYALLDLLM